MKKLYKLAILLFIFIGVGYFIFVNKFSWKIYTNSDFGFSLKYPSSLNISESFFDTKAKKWHVNFDDYSLFINNGYYFSDLDGKRPTVKQLLDYYKTDMEAQNEVKSFKIEEINFKDHIATKD